jgi:TRAP-type C4-dicarboxylate transport system substrate-binding protein
MTMKKRLVVTLLIMVFMLVNLSLYCKALAEEKQIKLKMSSPMPPGEISTKNVIIPLAKQIEEATKGRVKVDVYTGGALGRGADQYDMVREGTVDLAYSLQYYTAGVFPLTTVMELPDLGFAHSRPASLTFWELYKTLPAFQKEYSKVKVLGLWTTDACELFKKGKPVRSVNDFKGLKLRAMGPPDAQKINLLGATPVSMPAPEIYTSLDKGVVEGMFFSPGAAVSFKFQDVTNSITIVNSNATTFFLFMNLDSWNSLPKDIQQIMAEITGEKVAAMGSTAYDKLRKVALKTCKEAGLEIYTLPDEELAKIRALSSKIHEKWVKDMEAKGLPGQAVYDECRRLIKKYNR